MDAKHKDALVLCLGAAVVALLVTPFFTYPRERITNLTIVLPASSGTTNCTAEVHSVTNTTYWRGIWTGFVTNVVVVSTNYATEDRGLFLVPKPDPCLWTAKEMEQ